MNKKWRLNENVEGCKTIYSHKIFLNFTILCYQHHLARDNSFENKSFCLTSPSEPHSYYWWSFAAELTSESTSTMSGRLQIYWGY